MALTHVQTAAICVLTAALPLGYQWHAWGAARAEQRQLAASLNQARTEFHREDFRRAHQQRRVESIDRSLAWARRDLALRDRPAESTPSSAAAPGYAWFDQAPFVRIPKSVLDQVHFMPATGPGTRGKEPVADPVSSDGSVSESLADTLNLTPAEQTAVRESFAFMTPRFRQLEAEHLRVATEGPPPEFHVGQRDSITVVLGAFPEAGAQLESELRERITRNLGEDRATVIWAQSKEVFRSTFREFGALDEVFTLALDAPNNVAVWNGLRRPDEPRFESWGNSTGPIDLGSYPDPVRASFQHWLSERPTPGPATLESPQPPSL